MRAGRLRHRLILQKRVANTSPESRNGYGELSEAWTTQKTVWGGIEPISGKEFLAVGQNQNEAKVRIVMRYYSALADDWRIVHGGKAYSIHFIRNENERNRMLEVFCSEGIAEQGSISTGVALLDVSGDPILFVDGSAWELVA